MKVLTIGSDRNLFKDSAVLDRVKQYSDKTEEYYVIVFSTKSQKLNEKVLGNLHLIPTNSFTRLHYVFDAFRISKKIFKKEEDLKNWVVTTQDPFEAGMVGCLLKNKFKVKLQIQIHTDFLSPYFKNTALNRLRVLISKFVIPKADGLRVVSSVIRDSLVQKFSSLKDKIDILPIWVDSNIDYIDRKDDLNMKVLVVSRLEKEKRIDIVLNVFKQVLKKINNVELIIAGDGSLRKDLEFQVEKLGLNNVNFLGWYDDVSKLFIESNVYLLTSDFEGYGMTLLQAGSFGCAIVTTRVGLAKTDLFKDGENSYVCEVGAIDEISNKITDLLLDKNKRISFAQNMKESIKKLDKSREEYVREYISLLEKLIK